MIQGYHTTGFPVLLELSLSELMIASSRIDRVDVILQCSNKNLPFFFRKIDLETTTLMFYVTHQLVNVYTASCCH